MTSDGKMDWKTAVLAAIPLWDPGTWELIKGTISCAKCRQDFFLSYRDEAEGLPHGLKQAVAVKGPEPDVALVTCPHCKKTLRIPATAEEFRRFKAFLRSKAESEDA